MLDEEGLGNGVGVRSHTPSLRGLKGMHSQPQSFKLFLRPVFCMTPKYFHCSCLSLMWFCKYSSPFSPWAYLLHQWRSWGKTGWMNKQSCVLFLHKWSHFHFFSAFLLPFQHVPSPPIPSSQSDLSIQGAKYVLMCFRLLHFKLLHLPTMGTLVNSNRNKTSNMFCFSG